MITIETIWLYFPATPSQTEIIKDFASKCYTEYTICTHIVLRYNLELRLALAKRDPILRLGIYNKWTNEIVHETLSDKELRVALDMLLFSYSVLVNTEPIKVPPYFTDFWISHWNDKPLQIIQL